MIKGGIEKRDLICRMLGDISQIIAADCMYSVTDTKQFIAYKPGTSVDIKVKLGMPVPPQSPLADAAVQCRAVTKIVPAEVWGVPFRSTATPIVDNEGVVVGCVGIGLSIARETKLIDTYKRFAVLLGDINDETKEITHGVSKLSELNHNLTKVMEATTENTKQNQKLIAEIQSIAKVIDILAINASIEAAHAGEKGKGFTVVASEIQRLSLDTRRITTDIKTQLEQVQNAISKLEELSKSNNDEIAHQIDAIQSVMNTIENMENTAKEYGDSI